MKETIKANGRTITSVAGASFDNVWRILDNGQIHVAAPDTNSGPSELEESIRQTHAGVRWLVEETFDLGMGRRKKDTLRWFGGDRFEASCDGIVLTDGNGHTFPGLGTLSGRLIGNDPRRPDSMEYAFSGRPGVKITVKYRYDDDGNRPFYVPHYIDTTVTMRDRGQVSFVRNKIEKLVLGRVKDSARGFEYSDFVGRGTQSARPSLVIAQHGSTVVVDGSGTHEVSTPAEKRSFNAH